MKSQLLVRYGELGLKSPPVRREFERTLGRNILQQFQTAGLDCRLRADHGHLYVEAADLARALRLLQRVFGVTSASLVHEVESDRPTIQAAVLQLGAERLGQGARFAVRARRTGSHPFTSQELARDLGAAILGAWPDRALQVDLSEPEVEVHVEVRGPRTYIYYDRARGPGGLPLGVAGRVVALVDGPRGALGAYLMMKRGCRCDLIETPSGTPLVEGVLRRFEPDAAIVAAGPDPPEWQGAMAQAVEAHRADGVVLPLSVDEYPSARDFWKDRVVFSPTVGLTDEEVAARWQSVRELVE